MTGTGVFDPTGKTAGAPYGSVTDGEFPTFLESEITHPTHGDGFVDKGDPVNVGDLVGVAMKSAAAATDLVTIDTFGPYWLNVVASDDNGTSAVARGDALFINAGIVSKKSSGRFFGRALSTLTGSAVAAVCGVQVGAQMGLDIDASLIVVSEKGNDVVGNGSWGAPVASLTAALALVTTSRKSVLMLPGDYVEAAPIVWPNVNGILVKGLDGCGQVVISESSAGAAVITISPTFTTTTFEAFLENVSIKHTAQIGLKIDNAAMTRKLLVHLKGVSAEQVSTGDSIDVPHTTAGEAIRIYAEDCNEFEGLVDIVCANADDRFRFTKCTLIGGLTETGAVAGELLLHSSVVLASALTVNAAMVLTYRGSLYRTDAGVYTELADGYSA